MYLEAIGKEIKNIVSGDSIVVVTDENVSKLYLSMVLSSIEKAGFKSHSIIVPPGEGSKSQKEYFRIINFLADIPLTRADALVALGGGVVGDLTGFAAATYLRGIKVIQVPTTLLAAVDSSIGGKTGINLDAGKNLLGAFHKAALICFDEKVLDSLPEDIFRDGMAEVIKYGILQDRDLFEVLKDPSQTRKNMGKIIKRCREIKEEYVKNDQFDKGQRQMLNLGHTIGHAVEKLSNYQVSHGSAVAVGLYQISKIAAKMGWCSRETAEEVEEILQIWGFNLTFHDSKERIYDIIKKDKKRQGQTLTLVIPEAIGRCSLRGISMKELEAIL